MTTKPVNDQRFHRWRELLAERLDQAVAEIGSAAGVRGLVVGGSVGRDEPWPLSDIDILPRCQHSCRVLEGQCSGGNPHCATVWGYGAADPDGLAQAFATWVTKIRFNPVVVSARLEQRWTQVDDGRDRALNAMTADDRVGATLALREAAGALRLVLIEGWGERLSSLNREWTIFERMAKAHKGTCNAPD